MSATQRPWQLTDKPNDGCCWDRHIETVARDPRPSGLPAEMPWDYPLGSVADVSGQDNGELIVRAVNAFDALLAVAKGVAMDWSDYTEPDQLGPNVAAAMANLDAEHPGWRRWSS